MNTKSGLEHHEDRYTEFKRKRDQKEKEMRASVVLRTDEARFDQDKRRIENPYRAHTALHIAAERGEVR